jgi:ABC-2 type transport system permease protein
LIVCVLTVLGTLFAMIFRRQWRSRVSYWV